MAKEQIFPTLMIFLDVCASIVYVSCDWKRAVYWLAAAVLTWTVTY